MVTWIAATDCESAWAIHHPTNPNAADLTVSKEMPKGFRV